jgi:hypothetical protein
LDEEDLVATCQYAPAISLYTSTAFAVHASSFQTAPIETKAALRDHCKCKLSCVVPLYVLPSFNNTCVLFLEKSSPDLIICDIVPVKSRGWIQSLQNAIPHPCLYVIRVHDLAGSFSPVPEGHTETVAGVL